MQKTDEAKTKRIQSRKNTEQTKEKSKVKEKEYAVNKDFHTPKFDVTVKRVIKEIRLVKKLSGFQKPENGHVFIVVEVRREKHHKRIDEISCFTISGFSG